MDDPGVGYKVAYWTWALANMALAVGCGWAGVRAVRRGAVAVHRRRMLWAASLVALFLGSYGIKLLLLGREHLESWSARYVQVLRLHELAIATMLVAGATALYLAHKHELRRGPRVPLTPARAVGVRRHRRAGRTALIAAALGVATAAYVLYGMYERVSV